MRVSGVGLRESGFLAEGPPNILQAKRRTLMTPGLGPCFQGAKNQKWRVLQLLVSLVLAGYQFEACVLFLQSSTANSCASDHSRVLPTAAKPHLNPTWTQLDGDYAAVNDPRHSLSWLGL